MSFKYQNEIGRKMLALSEIIVVHKATRAGASTTLTIIGCISGKKIVLVEPNKKILREIEKNIKILAGNNVKIATILPNDELCLKLNKIPRLKFQLKKNCQNCEYVNNKYCKLQKILSEDFDVYLLTYDKLQVLQNSTSNEPQRLLEKLRRANIFIFDEFTKAILLNFLKIKIIEKDKNGNVSVIQEKIKFIRRISEETQHALELVLWSTIDFFLDKCYEITKEGVYTNDVIEISSESDNRLAFSVSWQLITELEQAGFDTKLLQDLTLLAFSKHFKLVIQNGQRVASPVIKDATGYLRDFYNSLKKNSTLFVVDACLPTLNYSEFFQNDVKHKVWGPKGDPLNTNQQQLLICDSAHWGVLNFLKGVKLRNTIKKFLKKLVSNFSPENVIITATNKKIINIISKWDLPKSVKITWYRSDLMRGLSIDNRRILICIGGPYVPKSAYTNEAESFKFKDLIEDFRQIPDEQMKDEISRSLRIFDTKSEMINAIGRPKDPKGRERSIVFLFGMQKYEVDALLKQSDDYPVSIPYVVEPVRKGGFIKDGLVLASLWLDDNVKELTAQHVEDLPTVSRIIRLFNKKTRLRASEVIPHETKKVVDVTKRNCELLKHHNINLRKIQGGYIFEK